MFECAKKYVRPGFEAFKEISFTLVVSFCFIFLASFAYALVNEGVDLASALVHVTEKNVNPIETFGYILGFLAPAMWIMVKHHDRWKHQWILKLLFGTQTFVSLAAIVIFILSFLEFTKNQQLANISSWVCFFAALLIWYLTLFYNKAVLENAEDQINQPTPDTQSGSDILASLRGGK